MRSTWTFHPRSHAFTLVELLVVVAIITLLIALLVPSLAAAKGRAKSAACLANLHSMGTAFQLYTQDNTDSLPWALYQVYNVPNPTDTTPVYAYIHWYDFIRPYMQTDSSTIDPNNPSLSDIPKSIKSCPSKPDNYPDYNPGYGMCVKLALPVKVPPGYGWCGWPSFDSANGNAYKPIPPVKTTAMANPLERPIAGDCRDFFLVNNENTVPPSFDPGAGDPARHGGPAGDLTNGLANYLFADSHAEELKGQVAAAKMSPAS